MRDPHVEELIYELNRNGTVDYKNPLPVEAELDGYRLRLTDGRLCVEMQRHYSSVDEARQIVEPFLRTWETEAFLKSGNEHLRFEFSDSHVVDRDPPGPEKPHMIRRSAKVSLTSAFSVTLTVQKEEYPQPPAYATLSPDAETLATRYRGYRDGKEPLLAMAYFCLTVVESRAGNRKDAATQYCLNRKVLDKIGELSTIRGDGNSARKYNEALKVLAPKERTWLDFAVRRMILQVAAVDAGERPDKLMMADLPNL